MKIRVNALILAISIQKRPSVLMVKATVFSVQSLFIPLRRLMMKTATIIIPSSMSRSFRSTRMSLISIFPLMGGKPITMRIILVVLFGFLIMMMLMERIAAVDPHPREGRRERMIVVGDLSKLYLVVMLMLRRKEKIAWAMDGMTCAIGVWNAIKKMLRSYRQIRCRMW